jgi:Phosphoinositide phospholipase C, Ca2+-dependent
MTWGIILKALKICALVGIAAATIGLSKQGEEWTESHVRINQVQVLGSHNSYKIAIRPEVLARYAQYDAEDAKALDYSHAPLTTQLDLGLRQLEIDVHHDPDGGLYASPLGEQWSGNAARELDPDGVLKKPGFKVFHKSDVDYRSHCLTFEICLRQLVQWSNDHPRHFPIAIAMNAKDSATEAVPGHAMPKAFDKQAFDALEKEILRVIPRDRIIAPDDVYRGGRVPYSNWPVLGQARGKFLFMLDEPVAKTRIYTGPRDDLHGKLIFTAAQEGSAADGYTVINNALKHGDKMARFVRAGWLMRTMSEQGTVEPRNGDYSRARASFASGAQYISTDYYYPETRFGKVYHIPYLPGGSTIRCNPVNAPKNCRSDLLDPYAPRPR